MASATDSVRWLYTKVQDNDDNGSYGKGRKREWFRA